MGLKDENRIHVRKKQNKKQNKKIQLGAYSDPILWKKPVPVITGQIPKLKCVWPGLAAVPAQSIEARF